MSFEYRTVGTERESVLNRSREHSSREVWWHTLMDISHIIQIWASTTKEDYSFFLPRRILSDEGLQILASPPLELLIRLEEDYFVGFITV